MAEWDVTTAYVGKFITEYGLLAIFGIMLLKEIGLPVPIPSDVIMLAAAVQSASGQFVAWQAFTALWIAMVLGAWAQYILARDLGRPFIYRFGKYIGLNEGRLDRATSAVLKGGAFGVGLSLATPGLRLAAIPASGMARLPYRSFFPGLMGGSAVFLAWHFAIGYAAGSMIGAALALWESPAPGVVVATLAVAFAGWLVLRRRLTAHSHCSPDDSIECLGGWTRASCPICLATAGMHYLRQLRRALT
ncbi:MAG: DedA family protein [Dehalococcoidia bacterium]|nr:DedA family protein [Dehalococcoidia bacterium]